MGLTPAAAEVRSARGSDGAGSKSGRDAFDEPKPAGKPVYSSAPLTDGDAAVVAVERGARGAGSGDSKIQEAMLKRQLRSRPPPPRRESTAVAARADAKVSVNLQALD